MPGERRIVRFNNRLTPEEKVMVDRTAARAHMSNTRLVVEAVKFYEAWLDHREAGQTPQERPESLMSWYEAQKP